MKGKDKLRIFGALNNKVLIGPEKVVVHITDRCNLDCTYCYYRVSRSKGCEKDMDFGVFKHIVDGCRAMGVEAISISGSGEPTLHPDIGRIIDYASSSGMKTILTTNGSFDKDTLKQVMKLDAVALSISSFDEGKFSKLQGGGSGMLNKITANAKLILALKNRTGAEAPFVQINCVIGKTNFMDVADMLALAKELGMDKVNFRLAIPNGLESGNTLSKGDMQKFGRVIEGIIKSCAGPAHDLEDVRSIIADSGFQRTGHPHRNSSRSFRPPACYNGWYNMSIDIRGNVSPCCQVPELVCGNIRDSSIGEIWKSERFQKTRTDGKNLYGGKFGACNYCYSRELNRRVHMIVSEAATKANA